MLQSRFIYLILLKHYLTNIAGAFLDRVTFEIVPEKTSVKGIAGSVSRLVVIITLTKILILGRIAVVVMTTELQIRLFCVASVVIWRKSTLIASILFVRRVILATIARTAVCIIVVAAI